MNNIQFSPVINNILQSPYFISIKQVPIDCGGGWFECHGQKNDYPEKY